MEAGRGGNGGHTPSRSAGCAATIALEGRSMPARIEIEVESRWDAVALMRRLDPYHSYLIQLGLTHWLVHAGCPGCHGEPLPSALEAIDQSLAARHVEGAEVRIDGRRRRRLSSRTDGP